jgi:hypothetical protein
VVTILVSLATVLLMLVAVFIVALLRSHAEILRRLAALDDRPGRGVGAAAPRGAGAALERSADVIGETLSGDSVKINLGESSPRTLLAFLSSGCGACQPIWRSLREGARIPADAELVVVAKGPDRESQSRLRELAPRDREILLSTKAWEDYAVPATPHFILVEAGRIAGGGTGGSWEQISAMVERAVADTAPGNQRPRARSTSERAGRAEDALSASGIRAGHPSLYPANGAAANEA